MTKIDYIPILKRTRIIIGHHPKGALNPTLILRVLTADESSVGPLAWRSVIDDYCGGPKALGETADVIRDAMRLVCKDVRERCAKHVADRACAAPHCVEPSCCGLRELAAAIRELEL